MKPVWTEDKKLGVELHKRDEIQLKMARLLGEMLVELRQPEGELLIEAVNVVLRAFSATTDAKADAKDESENQQEASRCKS